MAQFKINFKKLPIVFLTMMIIATAFVITGCGKTVIDVEESKILNVELTGFDGKGKIEVSVNEEKLEKLKKQYRDENNYSYVKKFLKSIKFELEDESVNGTLSNGDTVNIVVNYDEDIAEEGKISLEKDVIPYEIKNGTLKKGVEIDAFKGFKLTYTGDDGEGCVAKDTSGCDKLVEEAGIYFLVEGDNNGSLKNGDKVTIKVDCYDNLEEKGYFVKEKSKEFIVAGLTGARETLEGVDFSALAEEMRAELDSEYENKYDYAWDFNYIFESGKERDLDTINFKYTPNIELVRYAYAYDPSDYRTKNCLVAYYKITLKAECTHDQYEGKNPTPEQMKKGEIDTGVCYIAVKTNKAIMVSGENEIVNESMKYTVAGGLTMEECNKALEIDSYRETEYFDANYKKLDPSAVEATEPATEPATESATESATEATSEVATEATTDGATVAPTEATTEATTKKTE